jgi:hypothetical protein
MLFIIRNLQTIQSGNARVNAIFDSFVYGSERAFRGHSAGVGAALRTAVVNRADGEAFVSALWASILA